MNNYTFNNETPLKWLLFIFVFVVITVFFTAIHPLTIISGDDWINLSSGRSLILNGEVLTR